MTLGADKAYDTHAFHEQLAECDVVAHIAWNEGGKHRPIPAELERDAGYQMSQRRRKLVEEVFGWMKTVGGGRKLRDVGLARNQHWALFTGATYNLISIAKLELQTAA